MTDLSTNVVVFPDFQGRQSRSGDFPRLIRESLPDARVVAAINGADLVITNDDSVEYVYSPPSFNRAVLAGLARAVEVGDRVARVDTNEHDLHLLPRTLGMLDAADVVVADMAYDSSTLHPGSIEEYHSGFVIPSLVSFATGHRFSMSGSHGFMTFRREALEKVLPIVNDVLDIAVEEERLAGRPETCWSADSLLPIVAARIGLTVEVHLQPALSLRDNPMKKCATQAWDLQVLVDVLNRTLGTEIPTH